MVVERGSARQRRYSFTVPQLCIIEIGRWPSAYCGMHAILLGEH